MTTKEKGIALFFLLGMSVVGVVVFCIFYTLNELTYGH